MFLLALDLARELGILDRVKNKLIKKPDPALKYLANVIEEIYKTYCALDSELTNYLGVWFDLNDPTSNANNRRILIGLEGGNIRVRMAQSRGHCSKIKPIYDRYLNPWFAKALDAQEFNDIENLFTHLTTGDSEIIYTIDKLAEWLETRANLILDIVGQGRYQDANYEIERDRLMALPYRKDISEALRILYQVQAEIIELTGAI